MKLGLGIGLGFGKSPSPFNDYRVGTWVPALIADYRRNRYVGTTSPTVVRSGTATYTAADGSIVAASVDTARFDYRGAGGLLNSAARWLLVENGTTNLVKWSEDFSAADWSRVNTTVTANSAVAPDGTMTADTLTRANTSPAYTSTPVVAAIGSVVTTSVYAKAGGGRLGLRIQGSYPARADAVFDISNGTVVGTAATTYTGQSARINAVGGGWYRCELTCTAAVSAVVLMAVGPTDATLPVHGWEGGSLILSSVTLWGAQVEVSPVAQSYVKTSGAAVPRSQDAVAAIDLTGKIGTSLGVALDCYLDGVVGTVGMICQLDSGSDTGARVIVFYENANARFNIAVYNAANVLQGSAAFPTPLPSRLRLAIRYSTNLIQIVCNGVASAIDTSADFVAPQYARLGSTVAGTARPARMGVAQLLIGPAMSEAEALILGAAG